MPGYYILTNKATGHFYVGSSVNPVSRIYDHKSKLTRDIHKNLRFQLVFTAWEHIKIEIFETDTLEEARYREQQLISQHMTSPLCCNQATSVDDPTQGVITNEMRLATVGRANDAVRGVPKTLEHREKISQGRTGKMHSEESKAAISAAKTRAVEIDGKQYPSVTIAAEELGLNVNTLRDRLRRKRIKNK